MDPGYVKYNIKASAHKFSKNLGASSQFWCQTGDVKQIYWGHTNIRSYY